jgi:site-specific recombinase XerD
MAGSQLPLFQRKTYKGIIPSIPVDIRAPVGDMTVLETLPAYYTYLKDGGFSQYTPDDFVGDLKKFGVFLKDKQLKDITDKDILSWISFLKTPSPKGEGLSSKTVSRKISALSNYFSWLISSGVIKEKENPMLGITNTRISSPLPEILFEEECGRLLTTASGDPRTYLLFFLLLETGIKLEELFALKISHFDFSNKCLSC